MRLDLSDIPIIDDHCHPLLKMPSPSQGTAYRAFFTQSVDPEMAESHLEQGPFYRRAVRELSRLLRCQPNTEEILARRAKLTLGKFIKLLLEDAAIEILLVDYGYPREGGYSQEEMRQLFPCRLEAILRLEPLIEELIQSSQSFDELLCAFDDALVDVRAKGTVALKSVIAYASGLAIAPTPPKEAEEAFLSARSEAPPEKGRRPISKPLADFLVIRGMEHARRQDVPFQLHTGFGSAGIDLFRSNPFLLSPLLGSDEVKVGKIVLLHAGYPYVREASFMTGLYQNLYLDFSMMVPYLSANAPQLLREILSYAPASKLLYGSDATSIPEIHWAAASIGREALGRALGDMMENGELSEGEAHYFAQLILRDNAKRLYNL